MHQSKVRVVHLTLSLFLEENGEFDEDRTARELNELRENMANEYSAVHSASSIENQMMTQDELAYWLNRRDITELSAKEVFSDMESLR